MKRAQQPKNRQNVPLSNDERIINRTQQRKRKNRIKKLILRAVLGTTILVAGVIIAILLFFNINKISVTGDMIYTAEEIITASEVENGDNLVFLSKKKVNDLIAKKLPYVGEVKIKRRLPAHLEIIIVKTDACFSVSQDGKYTILDCSGKVLEANLESNRENLINLNAGKMTYAVAGELAQFEDAKLFSRAQEIYNMAKKVELTDLTAMNVTNLYNIKLEYQGRITIKLGNVEGEKLETKLEFGKSIIDKQNNEDNQFRGVLDLTIDKEGHLLEETSEPSTEPVTEPVTEPQSEEPVTDEGAETPSEPVSQAA